MRLLVCLALLVSCGVSLAQQQAPRSMHCTAAPSCDTPGKRCKAVEQTYTGAAAGKARDSIIQACVKANRVDPCNCVQACRQAAQCVPGDSRR